MQNIEITREFGVGLPQINLAEKSVKSSFDYPKGVGKLEFLSLSKERQVKIATGLIKKCRASFKCKVEKPELIGDHTLLIARVLVVHNEKELYLPDLIINLNEVIPCIHYRKSFYKNSEKYVFITGINNRLEIKKQYPTLPDGYYDDIRN